MRKRFALCVALLALVSGQALAQTTPVVGLREVAPGVHALVDGRVVVAPGQVLEQATIVIRNGIIETIGPEAQIPADARVWNVAGKTLYPGFIDAYSDVGMPSEVERNNVGPTYWNPQVRPFVDAAAEFRVDAARDRTLRNQGFTAAMAVPQLGMFRGSAAAVSLGDAPAGDRVLRSDIVHSLTLSRDGSAGGGYPTSRMGAISLIRQTLLDADWYARAWAAYGASPQGLRRPESDLALAALLPVLRGDRAVLVETTSDEDLLRALRLADEFSLSLWIRGSGTEYRILDALAGVNVPLILPVAFPATPSLDRPEDALGVSLTALRHWQLAPDNPARLAEAGFEFALTTSGLRDHGQFLPNVRRAVQRGLSPDVALAALTTTPARLLGIQQTHGTLEAGKAANIVVAEGDLFSESGTIRDVWVDGQRFEISTPVQVDPRGRWTVSVPDQPDLRGELTLSGTPARLTGEISGNGVQIRLSSAAFNEDARRLRLVFPGNELLMPGVVRLSATLSGNELFGWGDLPDGSTINWRGQRSGAPPANSPTNTSAPRRETTVPLREIRPHVDYGRERLPDQPEHLLVRNATIWTVGPQGKLEGADMLVQQGRIVSVGRGLDAPAGAVVINAAGKHVTPGLIDPHLHSGATGGVNETGGAIVPEVRIDDVLTIHDAWMYRQLAGGLTTAQVLHGSANPIGGQNQTVKLRWGALDNELLFEGAPRTLKFALGENVKRSSGRYPDTRLGTEQIIRDSFRAAQEYRKAWEEWERNREGIPPRRDLRLEALVDVMNGEMQAHVHAYRADEMLKTLRLAEDFGFRVTAFEHALEGYKIAEELQRHGAAAVVWTDWSSFKVESYDGITYNARILLEAGVLTSLHSDDSQIASRMNWEAGKLLRTGIGEEDALALVTINPARVLGVEARVGSLEPGKDADFVIWNGHPLSTTTRTEQTWVDGRRYFDLGEDRILRQQVQRERAALVQLILGQR